MPAYRSSAEAEIRAPVVERLRAMIPGCRIINEINASSFGNRIDVLAVGEDRIAAVEIKSAKDKLDRLQDQIKAMKRVTRNVYAALHEKFLTDTRGHAFPPEEARGAVSWIYPKAHRGGHVHCGLDWREKDHYSKPKFCLPSDAIWILWREEMHLILRGLGLKGISKLDMDECVDRIRWHMTGAETTRAICATLRRRECVEADPPMAANDNVPLLAGAA